MSSSARIGLVVAAVAVLIAAFVVLSPGGDDEPGRAGTGTAATTSPGTTSAPSSTTGNAPATTAPEPTATSGAAPAPTTPSYATIRVRGGAPVGGIRTIRVGKGDTVRIRVTSTDTSDEVHLHGYDLHGDVAPGHPARFSFPATAEGIFEIELEGAGVQLAKLVVEP